MKNMKKTLIYVLSAITLILFVCSGCKDRKNKKTVQEEEEIRTYTEEEYDEVNAQLEMTKKELALYDGSYKTQKAFKKKNIVQAGTWTYNKINDKIVLNRPEFETLLENVGYNSSVNLGDKLTVKTDSWLVNTNTSEIALCIPEHAYGKIKLYKYNMDDFAAQDVGIDFIEPYFTENNISVLSKREMYVNNNHIGQELTGSISILDSTTNGKQLTVPAISLFEDEQLRNWGLDNTSDVNVEVKLNDSKQLSSKYKVGIGNAGGLIIWYEFLMLDDSGVTNTNDLLNSINISKSELYLR